MNIVAFSEADVTRVKKRLFWNNVQDFFGGMWNKFTGNSSDSIVSKLIQKNLSIKDTQNLVSQVQWNDILKARRKALMKAHGVKALSQLVEGVRYELGSSVDNLTDTALGNVIYAIELSTKDERKERFMNYVKMISLTSPYWPMDLPARWAAQAKYDMEMYKAYQELVRLFRGD